MHVRRERVWCAALIAVAMSSFDAASGVADDAPSSHAAADSAGLGPTTAPPWLPDRVVPAAEPWETALRFPGRIASLPLSALGHVSRLGMVKIESSDFITKIAFHFRHLAVAGATLQPASLGDNTGLGVRTRLDPPWLGGVAGASWETSTRHYSRTRIDLAAGPITVEYGYDWRPTEPFHGIGPDTDDGDEATFAEQTQHLQVGLRHRFFAPGAPVRLEGRAFAGPREGIVRSGREDVSFEVRHPGLAGVLGRRVEHFAWGAGLRLDGRSGRPHWARGGLVDLTATRHDKPLEALALRTARTSYQRTTVEAELQGAWSFHRDPRTLRVAVRVVDNEFRGAGPVLLADLARLGGNRGLAGFVPGRFHDVDAIVGRFSYIFPLANRFELDAHVEAGDVYPDLWSDARLHGLETSYGVALRPRIDQGVLGSIGVEWCREGARVRFGIGGAE